MASEGGPHFGRSALHHAQAVARPHVFTTVVVVVVGVSILRASNITAHETALRTSVVDACGEPHWSHERDQGVLVSAPVIGHRP